MATEVARLQAVLSADTRQFNRAMDDSDRRMHRAGDTAKRAFGIVGKAALGAGAVLGGGLAVAAKIGFDEFQEGQRVAAQTAAVIKSTGGAAHVTAKEVDALAGALMRKSGMDDEAIKSGENMLLTFKNIRNETGKGNDIFNQSTAILADMSTALGTDMSKQAIQLGKALNDPIRGISALSRVGVTFTEQQREQIKALVDSGRTMDAQKIILHELTTEFGGSAEAAGKTFSGQLNILKETFKNTAGEVMARFMPILLDLAKNVLPLAGAALIAVAGFIDRYVIPAIRTVTGWFKTHRDTASSTFTDVRRIITNVWSWVRDNIFPIIGRLRDIAVQTFNRIRDVLRDNEPQIRNIMTGIRKLVTEVGTVLLWLAQNVVIPVLKPLFTTVLPTALGITIKVLDVMFTAIDKIRDGFIWIREHAAAAFGTFWAKVQKPLNLARDVFDKFASIVDKIIDGLRWLADNAGKVGGFFKSVATAGGRIGDGVVGVATGAPAVANSSISPTLWDDLGLANAYGLTLTSGYRAGAITSTGHPSLHGVFPSKAIDVAGSPAAMAAYFRAEVARGAPGIRELLYSPIGGYYPGVGIVPLTGSVLRDHYSHVHVGSYDQGGYLKPGWNLAYNGLGRPEPVGGAGAVTVYVQGSVITERELWTIVQREGLRFKRLNGTTGL